MRAPQQRVPPRPPAQRVLEAEEAGRFLSKPPASPLHPTRSRASESDVPSLDWLTSASPRPRQERRRGRWPQRAGTPALPSSAASDLSRWYRTPDATKYPGRRARPHPPYEGLVKSPAHPPNGALCDVLREARFAERPAAPREAVGVPAGEGGERRSLAGGVHEPAASRRRCPCASTWEGRELGPRSPKKTRSPGWRFARRMRRFAGNSPLMSYVVRPRRTLLEPRRAGERVQLVDAPDEARAVEAAAGVTPNERLRELGGRRPRRTGSRRRRRRA